MTIKEGDKVRVVGNTIKGKHPIGFEGVAYDFDDFNARVSRFAHSGEMSNWYRLSDLELIDNDDTATTTTDDYAAHAAKHAIKITVSIGDMVVIYDGTTAQ